MEDKMNAQVRAVMTYLSHRRRREEQACVVCGQVMPASLTTRRYCSQTCQKRAYRARRNPELAAQARARRARAKPS